MPRLPAKQREAEKISTPLPGGGYAASANDVPPRHAWDVSGYFLYELLGSKCSKPLYLFGQFFPWVSGTCNSFDFKLEGRPSQAEACD